MSNFVLVTVINFMDSAHSLDFFNSCQRDVSFLRITLLTIFYGDWFGVHCWQILPHTSGLLSA